MENTKELIPPEFSGTGINIIPERNKWVITQRGNYWCATRNAWVRTFLGATKYKSAANASCGIKLPNFYSF